MESKQIALKIERQGTEFISTDAQGTRTRHSSLAAAAQHMAYRLRPKDGAPERFYLWMGISEARPVIVSVPDEDE